MTTYFISRHSGAIKSVAHQHMPVDQRMAHLDPAIVRAGEIVVGSLPVNLVAPARARGAAYWRPSLELPAELRGQELGADDLGPLGARVEWFIDTDRNPQATTKEPPHA